MNNEVIELPTDYQNFIALSRYARWMESKKRRETWDETVNRVRDYWCEKFPKHKRVLHVIFQEVKKTEIMPSMRTMMSAGVPLDRDNVSGFNCAYVAADYPRVFDEILYILMCGTGDGFSVRRKYTEKLPEVAEAFYDTDTTIMVADSKIGWAKSYRELVAMLYQGQVPKWDVSKVRGAGERLKTFGGRASGPEPLVELFKHTVNAFRRFAGQKLPTIVVHDLICKVAEIVVVGGVRRSALISLSDRDDPYMRVAKSPFKTVEYTLLGHTEEGDKRKYSVVVNDAPYGERSLLLELDDWESEQLQRDHTVNWYYVHPERSLANNSISYDCKPSPTEFMEEWLALMVSNSGERGIFNEEAANRFVPTRRKEASGDQEYGCNPCSEILLRSKQFCNLSEVVIKSYDTKETILEKVRKATVIGTLQATLTNFRYLSKKWQDNTEEEALLGVSMTGIMDNPLTANMSDDDLEGFLEECTKVAIEENVKWAKKLGVNPAAAITCVKPSGTVSQLVDSASGIHTRFAPYYIRTVRADKKDPLALMMVDAGFPVEDDVMKPTTGFVFSFPIEAPKESVFRDDLDVIQQLELWKLYQEHYTEHKPSVTVYVKEDEWIRCGNWVYDNFDVLSGISFLPHSGGSYKQAPYQEITEEEYHAAVAAMPRDVNWSLLGNYEQEDNTETMQTLACSGTSCELP